MCRFLCKYLGNVGKCQGQKKVCGYVSEWNIWPLR